METREAKRFREIAAHVRELADFSTCECIAEQLEGIARDYEEQAKECVELRAMLPPHQRLRMVEL